jgi:hypothetical protein
MRVFSAGIGRYGSRDEFPQRRETCLGSRWHGEISDEKGDVVTQIEICLNCKIEPDCVLHTGKQHPDCPFFDTFATGDRGSIKYDKIARENGFKEAVAATNFLSGLGVSVQQIMNLFGCGRTTVYRWRKAGKMRGASIA